VCEDRARRECGAAKGTQPQLDQHAVRQSLALGRRTIADRDFEPGCSRGKSSAVIVRKPNDPTCGICAEELLNPGLNHFGCEGWAPTRHEIHEPATAVGDQGPSRPLSTPSASRSSARVGAPALVRIARPPLRWNSGTPDSSSCLDRADGGGRTPSSSAPWAKLLWR